MVVKSEIADWLSVLSSVLVTDALDLDDLTTRLAALPVLGGEAFAIEALQLMRVIAESVVDPVGFDSLKLSSFSDAQTDAAAQILLCVGLSLSAPRVAWISRPQARSARGRLQVAGEAALGHASALGAAAVDLYQWLSRLIEISVRIVSERAADAVPVVRVESGISLPSTVLAYQLYGDAKRAEGLVDIARSATPMLMPVAFEALES